MRTLLAAAVSALLALSVQHAVPQAHAEENTELAQEPPSTLTHELMRPLALAAKAWAAEKVTVQRISLFPRGVCLEARAPSEDAARGAFQRLSESPDLEAPLRDRAIRISDGLLRTDDHGVLFEVLVTADKIRPPPAPRDEELVKLLQNAEFKVMMRLRSKSAHPVARVTGGKTYMVHRRDYKPATAYAFLALAYNILAQRDVRRLVLRAGHWELSQSAASKDEPGTGLGSLEILWLPEEARRAAGETK